MPVGRFRTGLAVVGVLWGAVAHEAAAQSLGTFRWQLQPYCNVLTLAVEQKPTGYVFTGIDDRCGSGSPATATGAAAVSSGSTIALGLTIISPGGAATHLNATISLATISGSWQDADGNSGPFVFNPGAAGGPARPEPRTLSSLLVTSSQVAPGAIATAGLANEAVTAPKIAPAAVTGDKLAGAAVTGDKLAPGAVTADKLAAAVFAGTGAAATVARSDHTHDARYYTQAQVDARPNAAIVAMGIVIGSGTLAFRAPGSNVTVSRTGAGTYTITLLGHDVGCTNKWPIGMVTPGQTGRLATAIFVGVTDCLTGNADVNVVTSDLTGAAADSLFSFLVFSGRP